MFQKRSVTVDLLVLTLVLLGLLVGVGHSSPVQVIQQSTSTKITTRPTQEKTTTTGTQGETSNDQALVVTSVTAHSSGVLNVVETVRALVKQEKPEKDHWPLWGQIEIDGAEINGPIMYVDSLSGRAVQQYFAFTQEKDAAKTWTGPRDCSNGGEDDDKYSCVGKFLGWAAREGERGEEPEQFEVWLITRTKALPVAD